MNRDETDDRYASAVRTAVDRGLELIRRDLGDAPLLRWFDELLCVVLATHPGARSILEAVVSGQNAPQARSPVVVAAAVETIRERASDAAYMIATFHPEHRTADLAERARAGLARPLDADDPEHRDESLIVNVAWARCVTEMYDVIFPPSATRWRTLRGAFRLALNRSVRMAEDAEGATPMEKLVGMSEYIASYLVVGYALSMSRDDEDGPRGLLH